MDLATAVIRLGVSGQRDCGRVSERDGLEAGEDLGGRAAGDGHGDFDHVIGGSRIIGDGGCRDGGGGAASVGLAAGFPFHQISGPLIALGHVAGDGVGLIVAELEHAASGRDLGQACAENRRIRAQHIFHDVAETIAIRIVIRTFIEAGEDAGIGKGAIDPGSIGITAACGVGENQGVSSGSGQRPGLILIHFARHVDLQWTKILLLHPSRGASPDFERLRHDNVFAPTSHPGTTRSTI